MSMGQGCSKWLIVIFKLFSRKLTLMSWTTSNSNQQLQQATPTCLLVRPTVFVEITNVYNCFGPTKRRPSLFRIPSSNPALNNETHRHTLTHVGKNPVSTHAQCLTQSCYFTCFHYFPLWWAYNRPKNWKYASGTLCAFKTWNRCVMFRPFFWVKVAKTRFAFPNRHPKSPSHHECQSLAALRRTKLVCTLFLFQTRCRTKQQKHPS